MRRPYLPICACLLMCRAAPRAQAADTATLRLTGLPANAQVYIDARKTQMTGGILTLASGRHSIQIEAADSKGEVTAYYFAMDAAAGKTFEKQELSARPER